ncbi:MAG: acetyl-CoA carboxylase biotin carboxyl carrier protein subunit [Bacteroidetes bacterium]|nr:acetyl-CoA carboxylase biotin carboxyl carrier protein subunit [Bacteroidota bacterium]
MTVVTLAGTTHEVLQDVHQIWVDGQPSALNWVRKDNYTWQAEVNGKTWELVLRKHDPEKSLVYLSLNGKTLAAGYETLGQRLLKTIGIDPAASQVVKELKAPMPGLIKEILVQPGQAVEKGEPLIILEAMKMENVIKSPTQGTLAAVPVSQGQAVEKNQVLVSFS